MVINSNIAGTANSPLTKPNTPAASNAKAALPSGNAVAQESLSAFYSQGNQTPVSDVSDIPDAGNDALAGSAHSLIGNILQQPGQAMLAQANLSPETVLRLLQD
jgi:hypothetical protein